MTDAMQVYALKGDPDAAIDMRASLLEGIGRFGWSYMKNDRGDQLGSADLKQLKKTIETSGWHNLNQNDQERYQSFLLDFKKGDWVIYVNVPEFGQCTIAQVIGPYYWKVLGDDFNHCFSVDPKSVHSFDRNSDIVHPALSTRLKLQRRWWHIYAEDEFKALLLNIDAGVVPKKRTPSLVAALLGHEIEPLLEKITTRVQRTHPNFGLEELLEIVFKSIPGVQKVDRKRGKDDHGADLIVEFEGGLPHPVFQTQHKCLVQAKSYEGKQWETRAVEDIRRAFVKYPAADMGLIVSTATSSTKVLEAAIEELRRNSGKRVELLIGADVARFLLRFGGAVLGQKRVTSG
jgi:hypothetical protein